MDAREVAMQAKNSSVVQKSVQSVVSALRMVCWLNWSKTACLDDGCDTQARRHWTLPAYAKERILKITSPSTCSTNLSRLNRVLPASLKMPMLMCERDHISHQNHKYRFLSLWLSTMIFASALQARSILQAYTASQQHGASIHRAASLENHGPEG